MNMRKLHGKRGVVVACLAVIAAVLWAPTAMADNERKAVYVQSNTAPFNTVLIFDRNHDGTLTPAGSVLTGGAGQPAGNPPLGIPFLDSAGSVTASDNGKFVFVVNAGDSTVSSFRVTRHGLELADIVPSFGIRPISSTTDGHLLYVLNSDTGTASISGYRVGPRGGLTPIPGSVLPTSDPATGLPAQIEFNENGKVLAVSERQPGSGPGLLDTFVVGHHGVPAPAVAHPSSDLIPYGIAFTRRNQMIVGNEVLALGTQSSVSSYDVSRQGNVTPIETEPTNAGGACWVVITKDDKYAFVTNPFTFNLNSFRIERNGQLTPVNGDSIVYTSDGLTLDEALSHDSKYLYMLVSDFFASSKVQEFRVNHNGTVTLIGETPPFVGSASGTAAW